MPTARGCGYSGRAFGGSTRRRIDEETSAPEHARRLSRVTDTKLSSDKKGSSRTQPSHP